MADIADRSTDLLEGGAQPPPAIGRQLLGVFATIRGRPEKWVLLALAIGIVAVVCATALSQIWLNTWNRPFYDAIERKDVPTFVYQLFVFAAIASSLLVLNVLQTWGNQMIKVRLRETVTHDLLEQWLKPRRAFRLAGAGEIGTNPDQRIHEDARRLTELTADLGIGLFQSSLLLVSFIGVLWVLSQGVVLRFEGREYVVPGYMVWCALLYAATGSWLSWLLGHPLIGLNADRYAREANLRGALVRVNEHADGIAIQGGEDEERRRLHGRLNEVVDAMRSLVGALTRLTWVTAGYGWMAIVFPIMVAAPGYFGGTLTFGELMMTVGAFYQVQQALRWFVDNLSGIADWRATLLRVSTFRESLIRMDEAEPSAERIEVVEGGDDHIVMENLEVAFADACAVMAPARVEIRRGERVLIVGVPGCGKSMLFRAIAGLWPWGRGRLEIPSRADMMLLPQRPYIPVVPLRAALTYPAAPETVEEGAAVAALTKAGLRHLAGSLERTLRWDQDLTLDEQQRLGLARVLVKRPAWVVGDEAFDIMHKDLRAIVRSIFEEELAQTGLISISRHEPADGFYTQVLHLSRQPNPSPRGGEGGGQQAAG